LRQGVAIIPRVSVNNTNPANKIVFRWMYIVLPVVFFLLSLIMTAFFYRLLPSDIAYHFQGNSPDKWLGRGAFIAWLVIPQFFFTLLSFIVVRLVLLGSRYWPAEDTPMNKLLPVMGNMVALPQIIFLFAMLDFFLYNAYQIRLIPLWVITLIVMILGGAILGVFFIRTIRQFRRQQSKSPQE
jgi:uncharacterized protein YneF (UPF0154 family)